MRKLFIAILILVFSIILVNSEVQGSTTTSVSTSTTVPPTTTTTIIWMSVLITGTVSDMISGKPIEWAEISTDGGGYTFSDMDGYYNLYVKPGTWNMEASADGYVSFYETIEAYGEIITKDIELYPINVSTTTTTIDPNATTTTTSCIEGDPCCIESTYGEHSEQTELLRYFRDNVLSQTPAGQEIIRLYYQWSPAIVKMMEADEQFKQDVKEMVDGVLELIGGVE